MGSECSDAMATEQSYYPPDEGDETGFQQHDRQNGQAPRPQSAHGGYLAPPLEHGAIESDKQIEQNDEHDSTQDKPEYLLCDAQQVKNRQQHRTGERGLCLGIDIELPVQMLEVGQSLGPDEDGSERFDRHGTC